MNFNNYVQGYSKNVLDIIENFSINPLVEKLHKNKRLYLLIDKFTEFDLHPSKIDNHQMGSVYEELLRKFSEMSNEESGDHFTPRDVVKLLVSFVFGGDRKDLQGEGKIRSVFDPCCGTGGMLTIGKEWIHENINPNLKVDLYGQELNDVTYSICKSDLLMMDENPENIHGPCSSISDDRLQGRKFEHGSQELKKFLEQGKDIVITTIQKFPFISETIASLGNRTFGVIIDEVHSSQSGEMSKELKKSLSKSEEDDDDFDYEEMLRQEIQSRGKQSHISFFGFTGSGSYP